VLSGEAMNLEVQNFHPGYGDFINVAALRFFGVDLLSLRYPLVLAAFVQSCLVFRLLERRSLLLAASGSVTVTSIGVIQFLNPTPHWYCLCLTTALACWLVEVPRTRWARLVGAGLLIGTIALLRQLTGVFVAMAVLVVALGEASAPARGRDTWLARAILALLLLLLVGYLAFSRGVEVGGVVLFAAWPLAMLVLALKETRTTNRQAVTIVGQLAVGAVVSAFPLLWYCLEHGSLGPWLDDTVLAALWLPRLDIFLDTGAWYGALPIAGLYQAVTASAPTDVPGGLYWTALPLLALVNGVMAFARRRAGHREPDPLPVVAAFYALAVLYMQNAIYLYFTAGLSLTAVFWLSALWSRAHRVACVAVAIVLSTVGVLLHAAQPFTRSNSDLLRGRGRIAGPFVEPFARVGLRLSQSEQTPYRQLADVIRATTPAGAAMFAVPSDAELYFLADRRNPFRFYNTALGIRDAADLAQVMTRLKDDPPAVVTFRPADKYNTWASRAIIEDVRSRYDRIEDLGGVEVYRIRPSLGP
jgi:hypothetical protein